MRIGNSQRRAIRGARAGWWASGGLLAMLAVAGCSQPPAVEFDNLRYISLLRTAVSSRSAAMVDKVALAVEQRRTEAQMSDAEHAHFERIMQVARAGDWSEADQLAFAFEEAQLFRSRQRPPSAAHDHEHGHDHGH